VAKARIALDGVAILVSEPDSAVLFVSSPKARGAAQLLLPHYVSVCCDGPPTQTDFRELKGRLVDIWAPGGADGATWAAAIAGCVFDIAQRVRIINASDEPHGRDLPHYVAEGWDESRAVQWASDHARVVEESKSSELKIGRKHNGVAPVAQSGDSAIVTWAQMGLQCNSGGVPEATLSNASLIIQQHPFWARRLWFDEFRGRVCFDDGTPWNDQQDRNMTTWIQQQLRLPKISLALVHEAVCHAASTNPRHPLREWLNSLQHDGEPRLSEWVHDCFGVDRTEMSQAISRCWPIGMVARAFFPGVQMDNMPVLEGKMGRGKSSALSLLGGKWFASLPVAFGSKDFLQSIQGRWLIEVPDMTGFSKREHTQILATITTRDDSYRAPYARYPEDHPRVTVFAATSETDDYLQDRRGKRRYWPLRCHSLDLEALIAQRDQIFAEAVVEYRAGTLWHFDQTDDVEAEQNARVVEDPWERRIEYYCASRQEVTVDDILSACLELRTEQQTRREVLRISAILRALGWKQTVGKDHTGKSYRCWRVGT
jgi:putative DNA primase/helicase